MSRPAVGTAPAVPLQIRTVTVLGASGTMGAAAAGLFAAYGEAQVYVTGRDSRRTAAAVGRAARSVRGDSIRTRMTPVAWEELERAVAVSDLVFESVAEDAAVKAAVLARAAAAMRPSRMVYVSCDPATQARDLELLTRLGYRMERAWPVDLFPHTEHVETVVLLKQMVKG